LTTDPLQVILYAETIVTLQAAAAATATAEDDANHTRNWNVQRNQ